MEKRLSTFGDVHILSWSIDLNLILSHYIVVPFSRLQNIQN